ncbi:hypothetical protein C8F01DRAFT_199693 [Mycena amicta]|nr:hypothetical protein C8F01DRAFT_199693 [Mycena amicta]
MAASVSSTSAPFSNLPAANVKLFEAKARKAATFDDIGKAIGRDEIWVASAFSTASHKHLKSTTKEHIRDHRRRSTRANAHADGGHRDDLLGRGEVGHGKEIGLTAAERSLRLLTSRSRFAHSRRGYFIAAVSRVPGGGSLTSKSWVGHLSESVLS